VSFRRRHRAALLAAERGPAVLEVVPEHFFAAPGELDALAARYPLVFHAIGLSVGTASADPLGDAVTRAQLARIAGLVGRARPAMVSDHFAFTRSPDGRDLGHLCPLPCTEETLALVSRRVRLWQDALGVPIALENIAHPFLWQGCEMTEPELLGRLVQATGCGLLLDLTNLLYDARNFGFDAGAALQAYPLEAVWAVHLAGGERRQSDGFWVDSHSRALDVDALALLRLLRGRAPLRTVVIERDRLVPAPQALWDEAARAADVWRAA
jgi:uncharacterized protein (UPF0276 family)